MIHNIVPNESILGSVGKQTVAHVPGPRNSECLKPCSCTLGLSTRTTKRWHFPITMEPKG